MEIRPAPGDDEVSIGIWNTVKPDQAMAPADVASYKSAVAHFGAFLAYASDEAVGEGHCAIEAGQGFARANVSVLPHARRRGVGSALHAALADWTAEQGETVFATSVTDGDDESLAWAKRRGFEETGRESLLQLDLTSIEAPSVDPPPGIEIVTWAERPELTAGMYQVACEAYVDVPGEEDRVMESIEDWLAHDLGGSGDKPEWTFVALEGDEVVGYAKFSMTTARPDVAFHDITGVRRAWRGRGIAGALKRAEIAWAKRNGYRTLQTMNEERNTPIRILNQRFGYTVAPGRIFLRGPVNS